MIVNNLELSLPPYLKGFSYFIKTEEEWNFLDRILQILGSKNDEKTCQKTWSIYSDSKRRGEGKGGRMWWK